MAERASDLAVIGMACRCPGANDLDTFWANLAAGRESIARLDDDQLRASGVAEADLADPAYVKARPLLDDFDCFDAAFFGINDREAALMDPQHRILLECAWHALEDAGRAGPATERRTAVFAGASGSPYLAHVLGHLGGIPESPGDLDREIANGCDHIATRIAFKLDLRGPCVTVQTGCSTGLVALHLARQSLLTYDCDTALAAAIAVRVPHRVGYRHMPGGPLSPDGHCRPFDHRAAGTLFGSGTGVVVLRRLADALRDGDPIRAVIRGSAVNNDGADRVAYTAPSVGGQAEVIGIALAAADIAPATIGLVEAHGTATALGDPIEIAALVRTFGTTRSAPARCAIGSVKGNIGHLEAAAGIVGLIKAVCALERCALPPSLHFERPNPAIADWGPFQVLGELRTWPDSGHPRRAGVSAFGIGGTNAHVVLEEPPEPVAGSAETGDVVVLPVSAGSDANCRLLCARLAAHMRGRLDQSLGDIAYTLQCGRAPLAARVAVVAHTRDQAIAGLEAAADRRAPPLADGAGTPGALAALWCSGAAVDWAPLVGAGRRRVSLPTTPLERRRHWLDGPRLGPSRKAAVVGGSNVLPRIAHIWAECLGIAEGEAHGSFVSLGGHSLIALQVADRVADEFSIDVPIEAILSARSPAALAAYIDEARMMPNGSPA